MGFCAHPLEIANRGFSNIPSKLTLGDIQSFLFRGSVHKRNVFRLNLFTPGLS